jgi:hypothetical protein
MKKPLTKRKEQERDMEICRLVIVESGLRKRKTMHDVLRREAVNELIV